MTQRMRFVMGNWKMHGDMASIKSLLASLSNNLPVREALTCVVFPPTIYIPWVCAQVHDGLLQWGAQNVYSKDAGAYTGEVSAPMVAEFGCRFVLVGHSERRCLFHENEKSVTEKFHHVKEHGMIPVLCVGETLEQRQKGLTEAVLAQQLGVICDKNPRAFRGCVVAYEPVWAIGTGQTPSPEEVQCVHAFIRAWVAQSSVDDARDLSLLYGGSVNEKNASSFFSLPDVDGGLIGGASLHAQSFLEIVKCIN